MNIDFIKKMNDADFYSNKFTHIYFTDYVDDKSIDKLINDIEKANKSITKKNGAIIEPKPIIIHISSYGGSLTSGMRLLGLFKMSPIPIITMIDNYSCSAATFLSINSHYRLINNYGFCLIHGYSVSGYLSKKKQSDLKSMVNQYDSYFSEVIKMYLNKTKFRDKELVELLQHDLLLDANFCLKKGIVDRIITLKKKSKNNIKTDYNEIIKDNNNNIIISCNSEIPKLDKILSEDNLAPVIIHSKKENCKFAENLETTMFETLNMIPRILNIKSPVYAIIDSPISIDDLLPMLYCDHIFMFDYAYIISNILNFYSNKSLLLDDNKKNTDLLFNIIHQILKDNTKMTDDDINNIKSKFTMFNSSECKELKICNTIISSQI